MMTSDKNTDPVGHWVAAWIFRRPEGKGLLRRMRKRAGLTQAELAELVNVSQQLIAYYESGKRQPDPPTAGRMMGAFLADRGAREELPEALLEILQMVTAPDVYAFGLADLRRRNAGKESK